jgi:SAM-dependent methyltransferase
MIAFDVSEFNRREYEKSGITKAYQKAPYLFPGERSAVARIENEIHGGKLLDVGIGGGRTTPILLGLSPDYLGIDYSGEMVRIARERFPQADIRRMDARDLSGLGSGVFDFVLFSNNGIDSVSHADRLLVLRNIREVLKPSGWFAFSSHNLDGPIRRFTGLQWPKASRSIRRTLGEFHRFFLDCVHFRKLRHHEIRNNEYAVLNDCAHNYSLLTYYVTMEAQRVQLREAGLTGTFHCFDESGKEIHAKDRESVRLQYLVRKG